MCQTCTMTSSVNSVHFLIQISTFNLIRMSIFFNTPHSSVFKWVFGRLEEGWVSVDFVKELRSGDYTDLQTFNYNTTTITISHYMYMNDLLSKQIQVFCHYLSICGKNTSGQLKRNIIYILYIILYIFIYYVIVKLSRSAFKGGRGGRSPPP